MTQHERGNGGNTYEVVHSVTQGIELIKLMFRVSKRYTIMSMTLYMVQGFMPVIVLLSTQNLLNSVSLAWQSDKTWMLWQFLIFFFVFAMKNIIDSVQQYVEGNFQHFVSQSLNIMICDKSTTLGLQDYENPAVSDQLKRAQQEAGTRPYQMLSLIMSLASSLITVTSSAVLLMVWKWWILLVLIVTSFISIYSIVKINREQFQIDMGRTPLIRQSWYITYLLTNESTFKEIKIYRLGSFLLEKYRVLMQGFFNTDRRMLKKRTWVTLVYDFLELVVLMCLIGVALQEAYSRQILIGSLFGYIQAVILAQSQMKMIVQGGVQFAQNNLYLEQLFLFLARDTSDPAELQLQQTDSSLNELNIQEIIFDDVTFRYPGKLYDAVKNVSLTLQRGKTVALVGKNGSGKSTLIKLLMQLYGGYSGSIKVNGQDISELNIKRFQEQISVVFQDFVQYEMTARHNIGFGSLDLLENDAEIMRAAKYAAIDQIIEQLPEGLDTQLGRWFDDGFQLSGGQWQRVAIARAVVRSADVYILDEPSSSLDPLSERDLFLLFRDLMKERIGIFVTHRFGSAQLADLILVMDNGCIIEEGTHAELMALGGVYEEMYRVQADSFKTAEEALEGVGVHNG
ncbi:ABC transporter ATP-binding protein [Paenibacillus sp. MMS20-IR301]|uniref:ABC transporter ATP-binding protein n=1 Tax=Paenibacillus sp. MMS20-IR301 TaxID=2895946 RepID=UPI0028E91C22|nr:ABC transporter ATP-binding protein [Paenibacillus sp. MMS20-IR301]WNS41172.1 ABC transporter ATP-binding protein [Paenibacillus sp. MMS20-IR301]